jgi:aspartyl protease family protein
MLERGLLIITLVAGAGVGIFWPIHKHEPVAPPTSGAEVTLQRSSDSHFYATANVNGHDIRFLVDTGASEIALTEDDARKVGIKFDPSRYELLGEGASGYVRGQYVKLDDIQLDGFHQESTKAVVVEGANISLLGQPFLENVDEIIIRKGEMVLRDQG